ncbi:hypothetical protein EDD98_5189 [Streptomyces sp. PanSC19]|nr:hypothetical protein EDD98_5189 [Streptomyces sp. PanSC19]
MLAGRGIVSYSAAQLWMLREGKSSIEPLRLAELVIEFGEAVEQIPGLWDEYCTGLLNDQEFSERLEQIVTFMESWPLGRKEKSSHS